MRRTIIGLCLSTFLAFGARSAMAIYFVHQIAFPEQKWEAKLAGQYGWPSGVLELVNDDSRTVGWKRVFSELPNDLTLFEFEPADMASLNRVVKKFARVKDSGKKVLLSTDQGPSEKSKASAQLSLGSQTLINDWFGRLPNGQFGVHKLDKPYPAEPPILTLYVGNKQFDLDELNLPTSVEVERASGETKSRATPREQAIERFLAAQANRRDKRESK